jgi:hypothetical protein
MRFPHAAVDPGQYSADMREKREFAQAILNFTQDAKFIGEWEVSGSENRHDYTIAMPSGRAAVIELKDSLDGNNTNIFQRPSFSVTASAIQVFHETVPARRSHAAAISLMSFGEGGHRLETQFDLSHSVRRECRLPPD